MCTFKRLMFVSRLSALQAVCLLPVIDMEDKVGYYDTNGVQVIESRFVGGSLFCNGVARVKSKSESNVKGFFIDQRGNEVFSQWSRNYVWTFGFPIQAWTPNGTYPVPNTNIAHQNWDFVDSNGSIAFTIDTNRYSAHLCARSYTGDFAAVALHDDRHGSDFMEEDTMIYDVKTGACKALENACLFSCLGDTCVLLRGRFSKSGRKLQAYKDIFRRADPVWEMDNVMIYFLDPQTAYLSVKRFSPKSKYQTYSLSGEHMSNIDDTLDKFDNGIFRFYIYNGLVILGNENDERGVADLTGRIIVPIEKQGIDISLSGCILIYKDDAAGECTMTICDPSGAAKCSINGNFLPRRQFEDWIELVKYPGNGNVWINLVSWRKIAGKGVLES